MVAYKHHKMMSLKKQNAEAGGGNIIFNEKMAQRIAYN